VIASDLVFPEGCIRSWQFEIPASMSMPEAAEDFDDCPMLREYQIRLARDAFCVQTVPET
jgi:hypothetical protein